MARKKKTGSTNPDHPMNRKEWSINDFQMWLSGAYTLQGDDWVPNEDQWLMIVDIIYKLRERPRPAAPVAPQRPIVQQSVMNPAHQTPLPPQDSGSLLGNGAANPPLDEAELPPEARLSLSALDKLGKSGQLHAGAKAIKTPSIDTSKDGYKGSFD